MTLQPALAAPKDVPGWRSVTWGMHVEDAVTMFSGTRILQRPKSEIAACFFTYAVPLTFGAEEWDAWLCEDRDTGTIVAINIEKGYEGGIFFNGNKTGTRLYGQFLADLTAEFGPPHWRWRDCLNAIGNLTSQYKWQFPTTTITLVTRDSAKDWIALRFERANNRLDLGPGICRTPTEDLRPE